MNRTGSDKGVGASLQVWRFMDGKAGHEKQTKGFLDALRKRISVRQNLFPVQSNSVFRWLWQWMLGQFPEGNGLPAPDLLVGAGHRVHFAMLVARRARGGKILVLMKPSLPISWFDLCLVPEHDNLPDSERVLPTCGALTSVKRTSKKKSGTGLFLIGGPSTHFDWSNNEIVDQVRHIVEQGEGENVHWILTTSRRTPEAFSDLLHSMKLPNLLIKSFEETEANWVDDHLALSEVVWVSEDSVSMVYEALSSGCRVGLLRVPSKTQKSRVVNGIMSLKNKEWITLYDDWQTGVALHSGPKGFNEAARCAAIVSERWFS